MAVAYRRILVPLVEGAESEAAMAIACGLAAERGASVTAVAVIEVPPELPLDAHMHDEEAEAQKVLDATRAIAETYGVSSTRRLVRARASGEAVVEAAVDTDAEIVILRTVRSPSTSSRIAFGRTTRYVLEHAPCRVMVDTPRNPA
jgi:nucleotide-binding universal stress UspA family protein